MSKTFDEILERHRLRQIQKAAEAEAKRIHEAYLLEQAKELETKRERLAKYSAKKTFERILSKSHERHS